MNKRVAIKHWAEEDRPREKLLLHGQATLTDTELLGILIRSGSKHESALDIAQRIWASIKYKPEVMGKLTARDLMRYQGVGEAKAITIVAAIELGKRCILEPPVERKKIRSSDQVDYIFRPLISALKHEEFWILLLNRSNKIIGRFLVSKGGVAMAAVDPRVIFKLAIDHLASSIVLCHNHPSGNLQPSQSDIQLTQKLLKSGKMMDVPVVDHLIITETGYFSFADEGLL